MQAVIAMCLIISFIILATIILAKIKRSHREENLKKEMENRTYRENN
jgi:hypothetical protein